MNDTPSKTAFSVKGKTAIVTGAGSGINFEFAKLLLSNDCNVIIADLALRPEAEQLVDKYDGSSKTRAIFVRTDVAHWEQLSHMFDVADAEFGGTDIVCPGAGVYEPIWSSFWHPPGTTASRDPLLGGPDGVGRYALLDINLVHPIRATQLAISRWVNASADLKAGPDRPKCVVHVSSVAAHRASLVNPIYAASKAAVSSLVKSMAPLDQIGIRVTGVEPGLIKTPLWTDHPDKMATLEKDQAWVEPDAVAETMLRCIQEESIVGGSILSMSGNPAGVAEWKIDSPANYAGHSASNAMAAARKKVFEALAEPGWGVPGS